MSAQVIAALRRRADALNAEARRLTERLAAQPGMCATEDPAALFRIAREFRALADEAEGRGPQDEPDPVHRAAMERAWREGRSRAPQAGREQEHP